MSKNNNFLKKCIIIAICFLLSSLIMVILAVILPSTVGLDLLPNKPLEITVVWLFLCLMYFVCFGVFCAVKWKTWIKTIILLPNLITLPVILIVSVTFINTLIFTESVCVKLYEGISYSIVVREDDVAQGAEDLVDYKIEMLKGIDEAKIHSQLQTKTDWRYTTIYAKNGLKQMADDLMNDKTQAIVIRQERLDYLNDQIDGFRDNTKTIYTFGMESKGYKINNANSLPDSLVIYVNGFGSSEEFNSAIGESEVNLLMVVNRKQRKILFVNIPKNYYVQFAGVAGLKDKISSSGLYGIKESVETIKKLYDIDIDFYVSLDMDRTEKVIKQLDGIEITNKGLHNVDQQMIEAMIKKIIGTDILRRNYGNILQTMDGSFRTDMSNNMLMNALVYQIIAKHDWRFDSISAEGEGEILPTTGSSEKSPVYVLMPRETSILDVRERIEDILAER